MPSRKREIKVLSGDYFEPIKNKNLKFDGIYINPPLRQGRKSFLELINNIPSHLKPKGSFQFVIKKKMGASYILNHLKETFPDEKVDIICKRSGYWVFRCFHA